MEACERLQGMEEKIEDLEKKRQWAIIIEIENVRGDAVHIYKPMVYRLVNPICTSSHYRVH